MHVRPLYLLFASSFLASLRFFTPVIFYFLQQEGLSYTQIMIYVSVYYLTLLVADIPTGALADSRGKKLVMASGFWVMAASCLAVYLGSGFRLFVASNVVMAVGMSLTSGADSALLFEISRGAGAEGAYEKYQGYSISLQLAGIALSSAVTGLFAARSLRLTFLLSALAFVAAGLLALAIREPAARTGRRPRQHVIVAKSFSFVRSNGVVLRLILLSGTVHVMSKMLMPFTQPLLGRMGIEVGLFGVIFAGFYLVAAASAGLASRIEGRLGPMGTLAAIGISPALVYLLVAVVPGKAGILFLYCMEAIKGLYQPITYIYLNQRAPAEIRATLLSSMSTAGNLAYGVIGPLAGLVVDNLSMGLALVLMGSLFAVVSAALLLRMRGDYGLGRGEAGAACG